MGVHYSNAKPYVIILYYFDDNIQTGITWHSLHKHTSTSTGQQRPQVNNHDSKQTRNQNSQSSVLT